LEVKVEVGLK